MKKKHYKGNISPKESYNSYWCPECGNRINVRTDSPIKFELEYEQDIKITSTSINFDILCTKCDSYMIQIDYPLMDYIKILNSNGFITKYCCYGHLNTYMDGYKLNFYIDLPYITFANTSKNNEAKDIAKGLLGLQKYGFIEYEEQPDQWTIRAKHLTIETFIDSCNGFIDMVSELVTQLMAED